MSEASNLPAPAPSKGGRLEIERQPGKSDDRLISESLFHPPAVAAYMVNTWSRAINGKAPGADDYSLMDSVDVLREKVAAVQKGDLSDVESLLVSQAFQLNTIFNELLRRSGLNMGEHLDATDRYMRLALKAQGQCRTTLETLSAIKNPPVVFARQANIANGPQQVNYGIAVAPPTHVEKALPGQNGLLGSSDGERLEFGTARAAVSGDQALAALGEVDRPHKRSGQGQGRRKRLQGRTVEDPAGHDEGAERGAT